MNYKGLDETQVLKSRAYHGSNKVVLHSKKTFWQKYWNSLNDPIINILMISLGINIIFTFMGKVDWFEAAGIFVAVMVSTLVGNFSEYKNECVFQTMQAKAQNILCRVYRNSILVEIPMEEIVCNDYVLLQVGDMVPADGTLIEGDLTLDQSPLNGENKDIKKSSIDKNHAEPQNSNFWDQHTLYKGSIVTYGEGVIVVKAVGTSTIYGKMEHEIQIESRTSPLMIKLNDLAKHISRFAYMSGIILAVMFMMRCIFINNNFDPYLVREYFIDPIRVLSDLTESIILGIVVIVMSVPEGLPLMIAIVCSLNMKEMLKNNVLIRKLVGIETAGSINILFTDKTGTITNGQLEVVTFISGDVKEYRENLPQALAKILSLSIAGNSSAIESAGKIIGGNFTDRALLYYLRKLNSSVDFIVHKHIPFDSKKKFSMSKVSGQYSTNLIKGASEKILDNCRFYYNSEGERKTLESIETLNVFVNSLAQKSMRLIAFATSDNIVNGQLPNNMTLVGLIGLKDDIREEATQAIMDVTKAGVQVIMITGDKKETAAAIAKEVHILKTSSDIILTSDDLSRMSDGEIKFKLPNLRVVARALPSDKNRLVRLAQELNLVVGMTGDGINDSPALKYADVGFAMGSGSEVAKEAGDIVILDDNFCSIRKTILYGRTIYNSIKKFITFQLTINFSAVAVSFMASLFGIRKPLDITQMLWINLVMDTLAAIAFGGEPALARYLAERPKRRDQSILDKRMWCAILTNAIFVCFLSMFLLLTHIGRGLFRSADIYFYTGYFCFFIFSCVFNAFNTRVDGLDLVENISRNKRFLWIMIFIGIIQCLMVHYGGKWLHTSNLTINEWVSVILLSMLIIPVDMLRKKCLAVI